MEFLQLQYFFDTARTENFARTAEKHFVPSSSVSASIKRLEKELGCRLFDRQSNKITLNENGKKLQRSLSIIFDELDSVRSELNPPSQDHTTIRLLVRSIRARITNAIIDYRKNHPNVFFETVFDLDETRVDEFDLIIDEHTDRYTERKKFELCSLRIRIKAAPDSPLCGRAITMAQLRNQPFISMSESSNLHKMLLRACKNAGFSPMIVMKTNDTSCYGKCIASGMGIGLGRESKANSAGIADLYVTDFEERQTFYGYYHANEQNKCVQDFIDFLRRRDF